MNLLELFAVLRWDASEYEDGVKEAEDTATSLGSKVGGVLGTVGKIGVGAVAAAGAAVVGLTKSGVDAYGQYEQLVGGVETLFGAGGMGLADYAKSVGKSVTSAQKDYNNLKKAEDIVLKNSEKAFKTAGLSANAYMEQATSTAAALISSLDGDTVKAANLADQAIIDMSDNANKMGTSMESIQNAYNGFAKGNFTMLDNLKLGYGGTKEEMQRLLDKAGEISGYEYDISSYADIVDAIHVVQTEIGITGTTMKEADATIQGSGGSITAAWENVITAFGRGKEETGVAIQELVDAAGTYISNIIPRIGVILQSIGEGVVQIVPIIMEKLPGIAAELLPGLLSAAFGMVATIVENIPVMVQSISDTAISFMLGVDWVGLGLNIWEAIKSAFNSIYEWAYTTFTSATETIKTVDWEGVGSHAWDTISGAFKFVGSWFFTKFNEVPGKVKEVKWLELGKAILDFIKTAIMGTASMFKGFFEDAWNEVSKIDWLQLGTNIWNWIIDKLKDFATWAQAVFNLALTWIQNIDWADLGLKIWNWIIDKLKDFSGWAEAIFNLAWNKVKEINWLQLGSDIIGAIWDGIGDVAKGLGDLFEDAWSAVKKVDWLGLGVDIFNGIIDGIGDLAGWFTSAFDFSGIKIQWPHLTVTDWVNIPVVGSIPWGFRVDWWKKAMDTPYMFTKPTIFGAGEAGDEIMYGKSNLMRDIKEAVGDSGRTVSDNITINVYSQPGDDVDELARKVEQALTRFEEQRKAAYV